MRLSIVLFLVPLLTSLSVSSQTKEASVAAPFSIWTHHADEDGFLSNSHLIMGAREAILVDAQFNALEAKQVAEAIRSSGKMLSKIIITHPHPDHYYGLEILAAAFKDAVILGGPRTIREIEASMKHWVGDKDRGAHFAKSAVLEGSEGSFHLEHTAIVYKTWPDVESIENTVLLIPTQGALFVGDLASNGVHMWLSEGRLESWQARLQEIEAMGPFSVIYPGHGLKGGPALLAAAAQYLLDFQETLDTVATTGAAIERMTRLYPDYKMPQILLGSMQALQQP